MQKVTIIIKEGIVVGVMGLPSTTEIEVRDYTQWLGSTLYHEDLCHDSTGTYDKYIVDVVETSNDNEQQHKEKVT